jgi:DNA-binding transcriptional ArsR family regulator
MSYRDILAADRRLRILRLLAETDGYSSSDPPLVQALPGLGHRVSHDLVLADISWLQEQGLITTSDLGELVVSTLTTRGLDVAEGRAGHPGVARPRPED